MKRGVTTWVRPAHSGTWYPAYRTRETGSRHQDRYSAQRTSDPDALVASAGSKARAARRTREPNAPRHTRSIAPAARTASTVARASADAISLELQDDPDVAVLEEHVGQCRHADSPAAERKRIAVTKGKAGVRARQFAGGSLGHGTLEVRRPLQHAVVVDDDDAVA